MSHHDQLVRLAWALVVREQLQLSPGSLYSSSKSNETSGSNYGRGARTSASVGRACSAYVTAHRLGSIRLTQRSRVTRMPVFRSRIIGYTDWSRELQHASYSASHCLDRCGASASWLPTAAETRSFLGPSRVAPSWLCRAAPGKSLGDRRTPHGLHTVADESLSPS